MRLSRPRVLLRLVLLLCGAGYMAWKGWDTELSSRDAALAPGAALLLHRIALVEALLAVLALGAALSAGLALKARRPRRSLGLRPPPPGPGAQ